MQHLNGDAPQTSINTQMETTSTLANAIQLAALVFEKVSGREISNLEHHDSSVGSLIAAAINQNISGQ